MRLLYLVMVVLFCIGFGGMIFGTGFGNMSAITVSMNTGVLIAYATSSLIVAGNVLLFINRITCIKFIFYYQSVSIISIVGMYAFPDQDSLTQMNIGIAMLLTMLIYSIIAYLNRKKILKLAGFNSK
jgi:hypothetical protein